jgi:hypothetical protein
MKLTIAQILVHDASVVFNMLQNMIRRMLAHTSTYVIISVLYFLEVLPEAVVTFF